MLINDDRAIVVWQNC